MTEEQINEVVHLRHRLRATVALGIRDEETDNLLERLSALCCECGDTELRFEHARWCAHLALLQDGYRRHRRAS